MRTLMNKSRTNAPKFVFDMRRRGPTEGDTAEALTSLDWLWKRPQRERGQRARLIINHPRDMQKLCGLPALLHSHVIGTSENKFK